MAASKWKRKESGYAIVIVIVILITIVIVAFLLNSLGIHHVDFIRKHKSDASALYVAESGIARGIVKLKKDRNWDGTVDGSGNENRLTYLNVKMPNSDDTYTVKVFNNLNGKAPMNADKGVKVPPGACFILSKGQSGILSSKYVGAMVVSSSYFEYGLFGDKGININGNTKVVSYDSSTGMSVPGAAEVATNGTQKGAVTLNGSPVYVDGKAYAGYGADVANGDAILIHGFATLTGGKSSLLREKKLPSIVIPSNLPKRTITGNTLIPGDYSAAGTLVIGNDNIKLIGAPGGTKYIFSGIQGVGKGKLEIDATTGPVNVYLTGNVLFSGRSGTIIKYQNTSTVRAGDLRFLASDKVERIRLTGLSDFYGAIYAPNTTFNLSGDTKLYGGIAAKEISIVGDAQLNLDVTLKNVDELKSLVIGSWQYF